MISICCIIADATTHAMSQYRDVRRACRGAHCQVSCTPHVLIDEIQYVPEVSALYRSVGRPPRKQCGLPDIVSASLLAKDAIVLEHSVVINLIEIKKSAPWQRVDDSILSSLRLTGLRRRAAKGRVSA